MKKDKVEKAKSILQRTGLKKPHRNKEERDNEKTIKEKIMDMRYKQQKSSIQLISISEENSKIIGI